MPSAITSTSRTHATEKSSKIKSMCLLPKRVQKGHTSIVILRVDAECIYSMTAIDIRYDIIYANLNLISLVAHMHHVLESFVDGRMRWFLSRSLTRGTSTEVIAAFVRTYLWMYHLRLRGGWGFNILNMLLAGRVAASASSNAKASS